MQDEEIIAIVRAFDTMTAARLVAKLLEMPAGARVVLDFARAGRISTTATWILAPALLSPRGPRVVVRGLPRAQEQVLEYLGIPPALPLRRG